MQTKKQGPGHGLEISPEEEVVEVVVEFEEVRRGVVVGDAVEQLDEPALHGAARGVELAQQLQVRRVLAAGHQLRLSSNIIHDVVRHGYATVSVT